MGLPHSMTVSHSTSPMSYHGPR